MKEKKLHFRSLLVIIFFAFFALVLLIKITYLQVWRDDFFKRCARSQHVTLVPVEGERGNVYDCEERPLTANLSAFSVYADPCSVRDKGAVARELSRLLAVDEKAVRQKLDSSRRFVWIKRKITPAIKERLEKKGLDGVGTLREKKRVYLQSDIAAHILGGVNIDNRGIEGLELRYDRYLRGKEGVVSSQRDSVSNRLIFSPQLLHPQKGADIFLTIDAQVQYWVETFLKETIERFAARAGSVVVMNSVDGEILALANYPDFDPNCLGEFSPDQRRNRAITDTFEPGSVFKMVTLLGSLDRSIFKEDDIIFCENGSYKIPGTVLHDYRPYGDLCFSDVFKRSSNIGAAKIAHALGRDSLYGYIRTLGFGSPTGIDLPGEVSGLLDPPLRWSATSEYIIPIGQEIGVTLLQLARAMCVIANGGYEVKPHIVKKIVHEQFCKETPAFKKRLVPETVSRRARQVLCRVVSEDGTGRNARIEGLTVGGKTGTAQKFDLTLGKYSFSKYRASFVGFIQGKTDPIVIAVSIDEPVKSHLGGVVSAPLFKRIGEKITAYLENKNLERLVASAQGNTLRVEELP